jgi:2-oxoglutarate/2-oxoacid ferredoxin oxidoreductase subunit alpha
MAKFLLKGNEAVARGAMDAGLEGYFGYPITPQSEIIEYLAREMPKQNRVFVQAESEVAAINMVLGAAATGAIVMTSSSSPGVSLKQEGISYLAGCELPAVIVNVVRGGPGLGNIAPSQGDYFQATKGGGHGDYKNIVLAPNSVKELYSFMHKSFNLAFKYHNPVMIIADGVLGQMIENVDISKEGGSVVKGNLDWTLGKRNNKAQNIIRSLRLLPEDLEKHNLNMVAKYKEIAQSEQECEEYMMEDAETVIVAYGLSSRIAQAIIHDLRGQNLKVGMLRPITLWPFPYDIFAKYIGKVKQAWVIEMSAGQMLEDVKLAFESKFLIRFFGKLGGVVPSEKEIIDFFVKTKEVSNV